MVNRPSIIIADEPTANLDSESAARILDVLLSFHEVGVTLLVATHDAALVQRAPRRVLELQDGRLVP